MKTLYFHRTAIGLISKDMETVLPADLFKINDDCVELIGDAFPQSAIETWFRHYFQQAGLSRWRNETFPVFPLTGNREKQIGRLDRSIVGCLGIKGFGIHVNGIVHTDVGLKMWIGKRALHKKTSPGKLDQIVGGGMSDGMTAFDTMQKECEEEASIPMSLSSKAKFVSELTLLYHEGREIRPDTLYCYDLVLPQSFVPVNADGEVESFTLMSLTEVIECLKSGVFKANSMTVIVDFLTRHNLSVPSDLNYPKPVRHLF